MPVISFTGRVVPVPVPSNAALDALPAIRLEYDTGEVEVYVVKIIGHEVGVHIDVSEFSNERVEQIRNKSLDFARAALDLFNFQAGWGLSLYFDRFIGPDGRPEIIVPGHPQLSKLVTFRADAIATLYPSFAADAGLHMALNDLILAITWPHVATVNCARAVEGIRTLMYSGDKSKGWTIMRDALNLSEGYLRQITSISHEPRHGKRTWNPAASIEAIIEAAWTIMMRYMEWESRGSQPLPLSEFPNL